MSISVSSPIVQASPSVIGPGMISGEPGYPGVINEFSRGDHFHGTPSPYSLIGGDAATCGIGTTITPGSSLVAQGAGHVHGINFPSSPPSSVIPYVHTITTVGGYDEPVAFNGPYSTSSASLKVQLTGIILDEGIIMGDIVMYGWVAPITTAGTLEHILVNFSTEPIQFDNGNKYSIYDATLDTTMNFSQGAYAGGNAYMTISYIPPFVSLSFNFVNNTITGPQFDIYLSYPVYLIPPPS